MARSATPPLDISKIETLAFAGGGNHVIFRHSNGSMLSVPARRPIKPVYVRKFVRLIEEGVTE